MIMLIKLLYSSQPGVLAVMKNAFSGLVEGGLPNWTQKAVSLASDGASVYVGVRNGVIELFKTKAGNHVIPFQCMAHRYLNKASESLLFKSFCFTLRINGL